MIWKIKLALGVSCGIIILAFVLAVTFLSISIKEKNREIENLRVEKELIEKESETKLSQQKAESKIKEDFARVEIKEARGFSDEESAVFNELFGSFNNYELPDGDD